MLFSKVSYSLLMCWQRLDFKLAALFLWIMLDLASLSKNNYNNSWINYSNYSNSFLNP